MDKFLDLMDYLKAHHINQIYLNTQNNTAMIINNNTLKNL